MTAQQLKSSILQMAVQGKLVPQDPSDEPASVLLQRIKAEKQAMIKAGKIKKEKPLAPITEEEIPFDIPESWEWCRLKNIVSLLGDGIHGTPEYSETGKYFFINGNNLSEGNIIIKDDTKKVDESQYLKYRKELNDNTVFVSINGTIGNIAFYNNEPVILGKSACYFNLIIKEFKAYMYWLLKTDYFLKYAITNATGSTIKNVSLKTMNDFLVPLPPLEEQKRIVAKIEELLPYIEKYGKAEEHLTALNTTFPEALKKSILQEAVQGKLVPQNPDDEPASVLLERIRAEKQKLIKEGKIKKEKPLAPITEEEIPFDIPESWEWVHLQEICSLIADVDHNMPKAVPESEGKLFLSAKDLLDDGTINYTENVKYISQEDFDRLSKKAKPTLNDIIYSRIGAALGKARVVYSDRDFIVSYSCCVIRTLIDEEYLRYYLESPFILRHSVLARQSIGVPDLGMGEIKQYLVALPPLKEQKRIVAKIEELMQYCDKL